ncbi:MAG TPA: MarR family transcriptional regulator [Gaiellaceae bacterium]|jgi:DNA-binding MarR family transcriptional regulator
MPAGTRSEEYEAAAEFRLRLLAFQRRTEEVTSRCGLTPERYLLLLLIHVGEVRGERVNVSSLRAPLRLAQSSVSRLVDGAVRAGLATRTADTTDARRHFLSLTATGRGRLERAFAELGPDRGELARALRGSGFDAIA